MTPSKTHGRARALAVALTLPLGAALLRAAATRAAEQASAAPATIHGKVLDKATDAGMLLASVCALQNSGATAKLVNLSKGQRYDPAREPKATIWCTLTDEDGKYELKGLPVAEGKWTRYRYVVVFTYGGTWSMRTNVPVAAGKRTRADGLIDTTEADSPPAVDASAAPIEP